MKLNVSKQIQKSAYEQALATSQSDLAHTLAAVGIDSDTFDTEDTDRIQSLIDAENEAASYALTHQYKRVLQLCSIINNAASKLAEFE